MMCAGLTGNSAVWDALLAKEEAANAAAAAASMYKVQIKDVEMAPGVAKGDAGEDGKKKPICVAEPSSSSTDTSNPPSASNAAGSGAGMG